MIASPPGWRRRHTGRDIVLFPPEGPARGGIRYCERLAPLAPIRTLVDEALAGSSFAPARVGTPERFTTCEGEQAALVTVSGHVGGRPAQRDLGFVVLDGAYARTGSVSFRPDEFAWFTDLVRELVRGDLHLAGERRRWFEHDRPPGWQARARAGSQADWFPPDFPRDFAVICVWPALPLARVGTGFVDVLLGDDATWQPPEPVVSAHGLAGREWSSTGTVAGKPRRRLLGVLADQRYLYPLRLEAADHAHDATFRRLVASVRPVPQPAPGAPPLLGHWAE